MEAIGKIKMSMSQLGLNISNLTSMLTIAG